MGETTCSAQIADPKRQRLTRGITGQRGYLVQGRLEPRRHGGPTALDLDEPAEEERVLNQSLFAKGGLFWAVKRRVNPNAGEVLL